MEVLHGFFEELIIGPLKFKMAEIRHLENYKVVLSQGNVIRLLMKFCTQMQIWNSVTVT